jgi:hypothetical protein
VLRCGDSLLGADLQQIQAWNMRGEDAGTPTFWHNSIRVALDRAVRLRREIATLEETDVTVVERKADLLRQVQETMALVKLGGDLLVGSALAGEADDSEIMIQDRLPRFQLALTAAEEHERRP